MKEEAAVEFVMHKLVRQKPAKLKIRFGAARGDVRKFERILSRKLPGTKIEIECVPIEVACRCGFSGGVGLTESMNFARCPRCGRLAWIVKGNELIVHQF